MRRFPPPVGLLGTALMLAVLVVAGCGDDDGTRVDAGRDGGSASDAGPVDAAPTDACACLPDVGLTDLGAGPPTGPCVPPDGIGVEYAARAQPSVTLPAAGGSFADPTFGTEIVRVTDGTVGGDAQHAYAYWPVFNAGTTRFHIEVAGEPTLYDFDPVAGTPTRVGPLFEGAPCNWEDSFWSHADPDILFCHTPTPRRLYAYDVATRGIAGMTLIHDFDADLGAGPDVYLMQMLVSKNDDVFTFHTRDDVGARHKAIAYRRSDDRVWVRDYSGMALDETHVDGSGRYIIVHDGDHWDVWELSTDTIVAVNRNDTERGGLCHQAAGTNLYVGGDCWETGFLRRTLDRPLEPAHIVSFMTAAGAPEWDFDLHISINHADERWFLASLYSPAGASASDWSPWEQEIIAVAVDGSWVRRLAHHHSDFAPVGYWASPRASTSYDGRWAAFTSNFDGGRLDVFLMRLPTMCD